MSEDSPGFQRNEIVSQGSLLELRYRKMVFHFFHLVVGFCLVFLLAIIRVNIPHLKTEEWYMAAAKLTLAASIPLTVLIRCLFFFGPRLYSRYKADSSKLMITLAGSTREIYYEQICRLHFSKLSPRFFGGFKARLKSGGWLRFPSLMNHNSRLLELIKTARPDLATRAQYDHFLNTANLVEISWQRIRDKFKRWKLWTVKYFAYPALIAVLFHTRGYSIGAHRSTSQNILFWFGLIAAGQLLIALLLNHLEERVNNYHLLKNQSEGFRPKRDIEFEKKISKVIQVLFFLLTLTLAMFFLYGR